MTVKGVSWKPWKLKRRRCVRELVALRNKENREAVFEEDFERVKTLDTAIDLIRNTEYDKFHKVCPVCGEPTIAQAETGPVCFYGVGEADKNAVGKIENLDIQLCYNCGWSSIDGY